MNQQNEFWLTIGVPSGQPEGLRVIEMADWSGIALRFPKSRFRDENIGDHDVMGYPGVYVLWGTGDDGKLCLYIGETDSLVSRLNTHYSDKHKGYWEETLVLTSKDGSLNKAHVWFIESELVRIAQRIAEQTKSYQVLVGRESQPPHLTDRDQSVARRFLNSALRCIAVSGISFFKESPVSSGDLIRGTGGLETHENVPETTLFHLRGGQGRRAADAAGYPNGAEFVVLKGAIAAREEVPSASQLIRGNRAALVAAGHFVDRGDHYELVNDHVFGSPSTAAEAILGRSSNGRDVWKTENRESLNDLENRQ